MMQGAGTQFIHLGGERQCGAKYVVYNFKPDSLELITLNVRGLGNFRKRRTIFTLCRKQKADVIFLQETHSTKNVPSIPSQLVHATETGKSSDRLGLLGPSTTYILFILRFHALE